MKKINSILIILIVVLGLWSIKSTAQVTLGSNAGTLNTQYLGWNNTPTWDLSILHQGAYNINFYTNGGTTYPWANQRMTIDGVNGTGYVGIGLNFSAANLLDVRGGDINVTPFGGVNYGYKIGTGSGSPYVLWHNGDVTNVYLGVLAARGIATLSTGSFNTFGGYRTGYFNTTGKGGTFYGDSAGVNNTTGDENTYVGHLAGVFSTTGEQNTFIGSNAGYNCTLGDNNVFVGESAGFRNKGTSNTFTGRFAGNGNIDGHHNAFYGKHAGANNRDGNWNVFLGSHAGDLTGKINTLNDSNTFVGNDAGRKYLSGNANIFIGAFAQDLNNYSLHNAIAIGTDAIVTGNDEMILGGKIGINSVFVGIGLSGNATGPQNSLEINADAGRRPLPSSATATGLKFRQVTAIATPINGFGNAPNDRTITPWGRVLTVDNAGNVGLTDDIGGGSGTGFGNCPVLPLLLNDQGIQLQDASITGPTSHGYNIYFEGQDMDVGNGATTLLPPYNTTVIRSGVGIGMGDPVNSIFCPDLPAKFSVLEYVNGDLAVPTIAGWFRNLDPTSAPFGTAFEKRALYAITDASFFGNTNSINIGADFEALNCSEDNIALRARTGFGTPVVTAKNYTAGLFETYSTCTNDAIGIETNIARSGSSVGHDAFGIQANVGGGTIARFAYGVNATVTGGPIRNYGVSGTARLGSVSLGLEGIAQNAFLRNDGVQATGTGGTIARGLFAQANGASTANYGVWGSTNGGGTFNYGVLGRAPIFNCIAPNCNNAAGYFSGNLVWTGQSFHISDSTLKDSIQAINNGMSVINQLNPKTFVFKVTGYPTIDLPYGQQGGFLSQEVETVLPNLVKSFKSPPPVDTLGNPDTTAAIVDFKALDYTGLIPYTIAGLQELSLSIDTLRGRVTFGLCDEIPSLPSDAGIDLNDHNIYFAGQNHGADGEEEVPLVDDQNAVGIGYNCGDALPAKLSVNQTATSATGSPSMAGYFHNGDEETSTGVGIRIDGAPTNGTGLDIVASGIDYATGIRADVNGNGNSTGISANVIGDQSVGSSVVGAALTVQGGASTSGLNIDVGGYIPGNATGMNIMLYPLLQTGDMYGANIWAFGDYFNTNYVYGLSAYAFDGTRTVGVDAEAYGSTDAIGLYASTGGGASGVNYGVYAYGPTGSCSATTCYNAAGFFDGDLAYTGSLYNVSDAKLKDNVQPMQNAMDVINQLNPKSYTFKTQEYPTVGLSKGTQHGLIAQDIEQIPELSGLVKNFKVLPPMDTATHRFDSKVAEVDVKAVNYSGLIPYLIQGMKEQQQTIDSVKTENQQQQQTIDDLNSRLSQLEGIVSGCCTGGRTGSTPSGPTSPNNSPVQAIEVQLSNENSIILNQNDPNPFTEQTRISYNIPTDVNSAKIIFFDNLGRILKTVVVSERGAGQLNVFAGNLSSGIYSYSLIADGKVIDTKKMVCDK